MTEDLGDPTYDPIFGALSPRLWYTKYQDQVLLGRLYVEVRFLEQ